MLRPSLIEERAAFLGLALLLVGQEPQRRGQDAGERAEDGNGGLQRLDVVRCDAQQPVAFDDGFLDQAEFTVFEVADAAVDHVGRRAAGSLAVVAAFHEGHVHALQGEVAEGSDAVDAAADDQHLRVRPAPAGCGRTCVRSPASARCCGWLAVESLVPKRLPWALVPVRPLRGVAPFTTILWSNGKWSQALCTNVQIGPEMDRLTARPTRSGLHRCITCRTSPWTRSPANSGRPVPRCRGCCRLRGTPAWCRSRSATRSTPAPSSRA